MNKKKVLFVQSFSKNIYDINDLTFNNHIRYFNKNEYSFLFKNEQYDAGLFDFQKVKEYLQNYDIVVTLGCDCVITNFGIRIEDFSDNYLALSQESAFSRYFGTYCNGEILIFNKKDEKIFEICDLLDILQKKQQAEFIAQNPVPKKGYFYSTQSMFNNIFRDKHGLLQYIDYLPIGNLQSYVNKYVAITVLPEEEWRPGRFLMHAFGIPNSEKVEHIKEFLDYYPQYS